MTSEKRDKKETPRPEERPQTLRVEALEERVAPGGLGLGLGLSVKVGIGIGIGCGCGC